MDNITSLQAVIGKLESVFDKCNERFYDGELERPVIVVSPDVTGGAYGWCTAWKSWQMEGTNGFYEINICAEYLNRPFEEICGTLLHEMVHLWCLQNGIKDTSRGGSYHNKKFKVEAEERGLKIDKHEKYGWTITELNEEGQEFVEEVGKVDFELHRTPMEKKERTKRKSSSRKYVCPSCGMSLRATKEINIICGDCNEKLEVEEKDEE